jgi:hypothetical protein
MKGTAGDSRFNELLGYKVKKRNKSDMHALLEDLI